MKSLLLLFLLTTTAFAQAAPDTLVSVLTPIIFTKG